MKRYHSRDRGRIQTIRLKQPVRINSCVIDTAVIEIDHINYGLDKSKRQLNLKRRSNFSLTDIEKFIYMLDEEYIIPRSYKGRISRFEFRIKCPALGKFYSREFIMIVDIDDNLTNQIHVVTIFPGW